MKYNIDLDKIEKVIRHDIEHGFPSAQLVILQNNQELYNKAFGKNVTTNTLYDLASNTKMYATNYALQYLYDNNELDLNTTLSELFGFDNDIRIIDLLQHKSGYPADPEYHKHSQSTNVLELIANTKLISKPRTKVLYSDVDYMLLGLIVEKLTNMSLDKFCAKTFYQPLGLMHTTFNPLKNNFKKEDCAPTELNGNTRDGAIYFKGIRKYTIQGEVHDEKAWYTCSGVSGHAGLFSNASDLSKLEMLMLNGYFSKKTIDTFTKKTSNDYGLGWKYFGENIIGHTGWTGTFTLIDLENNIVVALLTNKVNTHVIDNTKNPNKFYGHQFKTGQYKFIQEILYSDFVK